MASSNEPNIISIRIFGFLQKYMDEQGRPYAFEKEIDPKGKAACDIARELRIPTKEVEGVFINGSVENIDDPVFPGDRVAFLPYGTPGPYRVFLGMARENVERARREKKMSNSKTQG
ncbi:MAG: MoaD/ThiS family protein [Deltaproteobacteria bacterium]|nr:MoaD/ThiS family protein [Deltaproteobacteria bacterium]